MTYIEILKHHLEHHPPNFGDHDAEGVLDMLYSSYNQCNPMDTPAISAAFDELYQQMNGMPLREMDKVIYTVCTLCREHERAGFTEGVKVGMLIEREVL